MPAMIAARLYRLIPLIVILAIIGIIVYLVVAWRYTDTKAKEMVIKAFIWTNGILSGVFALATLYAVIESNWFVMDFFATCLAFMLIMLGCTFLAKHQFLKHHPNYKWKVTSKSTITSPFDAFNPFKRK